MIQSISFFHYRSIYNLSLSLSGLNLVTGANGSGKSNFYRALRLLAETAKSGVVSSLAKEGGLNSTYWAGPEVVSRAARNNRQVAQGLMSTPSKRLKLGFSGEDFGYAISLGLPVPTRSAFSLDPEIKSESIWAGQTYQPARVLTERKGRMIRSRDEDGWVTVADHVPTYESLFDHAATPNLCPEVVALRERIRNWRFYDHFRADADAPARLPQLGTRTTILSNDGHDLAAAIQTILEIGDGGELRAAIEDAFPGASLQVIHLSDGRFTLELQQEGLLRPLRASEWSDGTLRYIMWCAALLTPRPPELMVINEPETSLHPDLLPALGRRIVHLADHCQVWVISHSPELIHTITQSEHTKHIQLVKEMGQTSVQGQSLLDTPNWKWPND